jgi:general secretion pathway protein J
MTSRAGRARGSMAGFTLVEILVVMTLLSLVMLALGAAMRTIAQTEQRVDLRLQRADELRVATNFLSSTLGRISARKSTVPTQAGTSTYQFSGNPDEAVWIGVMPARFGAGGRYFFRLALERFGSDRGLVIRFVPWTPGAVIPPWNTAESRVLVGGVQGMSLEYAEPNSGIGWQPQWREADKLPTRVRIALRTGTGDWPELIIPMRALPAGDNGRGGFSLGPES